MPTDPIGGAVTARRPGSASPGADDAGPSARRRRRRGKLTPYLFVAPFLVVFFLFLLWPIVNAFISSLFVERLIGGRSFAGGTNYVRVFNDPLFWAGVRRVIVFGVVQITVMITLATAFAIALDRMTSRLREVFRLGIFLPFAVPSAVAALMWGFLYSRNIGPAPQIAELFGTTAPNLLSADIILWSIGNIVTWSFVGYNMIIIYAALTTVPHDVYEAAAIDGATNWQTTRRITLPLIRPALLLATVFSIIGTLQLFNEPMILRQIAPQAIDSAFTPNLYAFNLSFVSQDLPYAAAVSFIIGVVAFILSYVFMMSSRGDA
jgi:multiple sugar transport system permease protein